MLKLRSVDRPAFRRWMASALAACATVPMGLALAGCANEARGESEPLPAAVKPPAKATVAPTATATATAVDVKPVMPAPSAAPVAALQPCPDGAVLIPGGTLKTLERARDVTVGSYCLDKHEVTVAEYRACVKRGDCTRECKGEDGCEPVPKRTSWGDPSADWNASMFCNGRREGRDEHPINCVSIEEAQSYCAAQGRRLPQGDEWEWAARGGNGSYITPWGNPVAKDEICWGKPKQRDGTCAKGSHPRDRTVHGVEALGGGVSEWVTGPRRAGGDKSLVRFAYGASWYAIDDGYARAALGGFEMPAKRAETTGFRCARDRASENAR